MKATDKDRHINTIPEGVWEAGRTNDKTKNISPKDRPENRSQTPKK